MFTTKWGVRILHHYSDLAEIEKLFARFAIRRVELEEQIEEGNRHSHWQVLVEKEYDR